jgi:hypothetical protein
MSAHFLPLQTRIPHTRLRLNSFLTSDRNKQHWAEKFYVDYIRLHKDRVKPHRQSLQASQGQTLSPDSSPRWTDASTTKFALCTGQRCLSRLSLKETEGLFPEIPQNHRALHLSSKLTLNLEVQW